MSKSFNSFFSIFVKTLVLLGVNFIYRVDYQFKSKGSMWGYLYLKFTYSFEASFWFYFSLSWWKSQLVKTVGCRWSLDNHEACILSLLLDFFWPNDSVLHQMLLLSYLSTLCISNLSLSIIVSQTHERLPH